MSSLNSPYYTLTHTFCSTCSCGANCPPGLVTTLCHMSTDRHEPPRHTVTHTSFFHPTCSFTATGNPEHFTFPSVVQQMCLSSKQKERLSWKCSQSANEQAARDQATFLCFFFSLHVNSRLFTSALLHPQGDGWLLLLRLMPKGYRANGPVVLGGL